MIIKALELTYFGGLAKVLIPQQTENGVLRNSDTLYPLTIKFLTIELKSCVKDRQRDTETGIVYDQTKEYPIIDFDLEHPFGNHKERIAWRTSIWNLAVYRSLEIWKLLPNSKIEKSLGVLTDYAKKSLKGKLGAGNKKNFEKVDNQYWQLKSFKVTKYENIFQPFSDKAIEICKQRARKK